MTETDILRAIHATLGARADVRLWRTQVGVFVPVSRACKACRAHSMRIGIPGQADLLGIHAPSGRLLSLEVKSATGRVREEQEAWAVMVRRFGGVAGVVRSVEDAEELLQLEASCRGARQLEASSEAVGGQPCSKNGSVTPSRSDGSASAPTPRVGGT